MTCRCYCYSTLYTQTSPGVPASPSMRSSEPGCYPTPSSGCYKKISCQKHLKIQIYTEGRVPQEFFCTCWKACFKLVRMVESAEGLELPKILKFRHQRKNTFLYFLLKWIRMTLKLLSCSSSDNCRLYFPCICTRAGNSLFDRRAMVVIKTSIDNRCFTVL